MSATILGFPDSRSRGVIMARMTQDVASRSLGLEISFGDALEIYRETRRHELTAEGKSMARDVARSLGIEMKPE